MCRKAAHHLRRHFAHRQRKTRRLGRVHYAARSRPLRWGKCIMLFVYDAIDGDVGKELRKKSPEPRFFGNHHQWLKKIGPDKVHDQIERVITIMKLCNNMTDFRECSLGCSRKASHNFLCSISTCRNERGRQRRRPYFVNIKAAVKATVSRPAATTHMRNKRSFAKGRSSALRMVVIHTG